MPETPTEKRNVLLLPIQIDHLPTGGLVVRVVGHAVRDVVRFPTVVVVGLAGIPLLLTAAVWIGGWLVGAQRVAVRTAGADFD